MIFSCRPWAAAALGTGFCCLLFVVVTHLASLLFKLALQINNNISIVQNCLELLSFTQHCSALLSFTQHCSAVVSISQHTQHCVALSIVLPIIRIAWNQHCLELTLLSISIRVSQHQSLHFLAFLLVVFSAIQSNMPSRQRRSENSIFSLV